MPEFTQRFRFADWPNTEVPLVAAGIYAIWDGDVLIYCGMAGRELEEARIAAKPRYGLVLRLASHASGRLSGDQFCVYVANRLVIPSLTPEQLAKFSSGDLNLDALTRSYIHERLEYQYAMVPSSVQAYEIEKSCRFGDQFGVKPLLNPL
jgi:hypothetical protein